MANPIILWQPSRARAGKTVECVCRTCNFFIIAYATQPAAAAAAL